MMPFKTKLTPNFKMDWGVKYPRAKYPLHDKLPVKIFDLKAFVEKKREDKINNMLEGGNLPGGFPGFKGGGMPLNMPSMNPMNQINPFSSNKESFDIDEMVKRIDAKIAELEEEEKQEKANKDNVDAAVDLNNNNSADVDDINKKDYNSKVPEDKKNNITDDQFFDDFFSDD